MFFSSFPQRAISMLEEVIKVRFSLHRYIARTHIAPKDQQDEWHPNHYILFLAKLNLVGCYLQPGNGFRIMSYDLLTLQKVCDFRRCLELSEEICASVEAVFLTTR